MRTANIARDTKETQITLSLNLDGTGRSDIQTGCGFLNHMLELFARHGDFDLTLTCHGDTEVDYHHTTEDIGIVLGQAFTKALGDKRGIVRYGQFFLPMDETLVLCAVDLSGRDCLVWHWTSPPRKSAISIPNLRRSSGLDSCGTVLARYISGSSPGRTRTTF